ncbi:elongation factor P maturation arginine rhamnosyltransferase EarP [Pseudomonas nicosulfuronedens]|uniref:Protein-arginine rhamnosyltransferase n=1 Tax=Pseudomonas nicosulfuronedens TaxID=2571105 RepID=A0A5R9R7T1_9PSED|nr:elongation factor P maturation arginine rhamnosyltransferase EarP [Pseudomonas nicosulfuronedens]MDH1010295.1 elongation factor P maturation arginine rhamnosyltransferase EarP [Pseudomonas nicosulfuronedens]MDH1980224.1 elongation factor P maturation arginine rhamnosyltransferase EarP [Pseudomonas nicosulfuronedens]MDH2025530.1 elongation factor P maturation arginine rhamnosyltransferase EarP [Pseudomonas nicosulfuronedens]TLX78933.1 elongation factor P maturation arginine rhamnosyltransfera
MASWDIFCSVVDNYGDIGVTWRLARQLAGEHRQQVRLWVDDLAAFVRICPAADGAADVQQQSGVDVRLWPKPWRDTPAADVVVEAFACEMPAAYIEAMRERRTPSLWLNLEYLSAESWVESCHGLPSMQASGLQKYFYFPGFTTATGGLLREGDLIARRDAFQADPAASLRFLDSLGVRPQVHERRISLFAYENAALGGWLDALAASSIATLLLVPEGRVLADVERWAGQVLGVGKQYQKDSLRVQVLPFVRQEDYDPLLWSCDFNAVRGEDSFVRAQWAGRPFVWHIYQQDEDVHLEKLEAFLGLFGEGMNVTLRSELTAFWMAWNGLGDSGEAWRKLESRLPEWAAWIGNWQRRLTEQTDLATGLVRFYTNWL